MTLTINLSVQMEVRKIFGMDVTIKGVTFGAVLLPTFLVKNQMEQVFTVISHVPITMDQEKLVKKVFQDCAAT